MHDKVDVSMCMDDRSLHGKLLRKLFDYVVLFFVLAWHVYDSLRFVCERGACRRRPSLSVVTLGAHEIRTSASAAVASFTPMYQHVDLHDR